MTRLLIVGLGHQGRRHVRTALKHPGAAVAGTVDPAAARYGGVRNFASLDRALDAVERVDAAIVATPTIDHVDSARILLEQGIPVLVEKPLAATVEDAAHLSDVARATGTLLAVGHVERFNPAVQLVHSLLRRGVLGRPIALAFRRVGLPPPSPGGVDVLHDLAVHDIDVFGLLAGVPPELEGASGWSANGLVESAHLLLRANDVTGLVQVNWRTPVRVRDFTLTTDECYIEVNYTTQVVQTVEAAEAGETLDFQEFQDAYGMPHRARLACQPAEPLIEQLGAFLAAVETGETDPLLATAEDGLRALVLAHTAGHAIRSGTETAAIGRRSPTSGDPEPPPRSPQPPERPCSLLAGA